MDWEPFLGWLLVMLAYLWSAFCIALGVYALLMKHTKLWVAILIKTLAVLVLLYGLYEGVATTLTLMHGPAVSA